MPAGGLVIDLMAPQAANGCGRCRSTLGLLGLPTNIDGHLSPAPPVPSPSPLATPAIMVDCKECGPAQTKQDQMIAGRSSMKPLVSSVTALNQYRTFVDCNESFIAQQHTVREL
ncbi:hypothetical protein EXN66_Car019896 [Channa argus]|uniref:Uncharacterized protein n=1 Tax=Channa argus TaxID=215402 RepID=A0A6G1QP06_CHAAH|nr:hypothetical protein EXN66_Car019896 [Channa argus]